jgi:branched-chain amino acid transport system ATP-binding protein
MIAAPLIGRPKTYNTQFEEKPALLTIDNLTHYFLKLRAVNNFSMTVKEGELVGVIGPNGAGKTTIFNLITGVYRASRGKILRGGIDLVGLPPYEIVQMGIARTFQSIRLFSNLTVLDNVCIAYHAHAGYSLKDSILQNQLFAKNESRLIGQAQEFLSIFGLEDRQDDAAGSLPYGMQRRLEIARALAAYPQILLLDEPAAGMNPQEIEELMQLIQSIRKQFNLTILLIEHRMRLVMSICDWLTVMNFGEVIAQDIPERICQDQAVIDAYLGCQNED